MSGEKIATIVFLLIVLPFIFLMMTEVLRDLLKDALKIKEQRKVKK